MWGAKHLGRKWQRCKIIKKKNHRLAEAPSLGIMKETSPNETKSMMWKVKGERKGEVEAGKKKSGNGWCMDVRNVVGHRVTYWITSVSSKGRKKENCQQFFMNLFDLGYFLIGQQSKYIVLTLSWFLYDRMSYVFTWEWACRTVYTLMYTQWT